MTNPLDPLLERAQLSAAELRRLRRELHRVPELAFEEWQTTEIVQSRLRAAGLEVSATPGTTGLIGVLRGAHPGRTVAWRADLDALPIQEPPGLEFVSQRPGVMHACGHDGHVAVAVLAAEALATQRERMHGDVGFIFQAAEEVFAGARALLAANALAAHGIEELYGLHLTTHLPAGTVAVGPGTMWASADTFSIEISGQGGHGAFPHLTRSPVICAAEIILALNALVAREVAATEVATLSVGQVSAGTAPNVIPSRASLAGSMRTLALSTRERLLARIPELVSQLCVMHGTAATVTWSERACPPLTNAVHCADHVKRCARSVLGAEQVQASGPSLASDDIALLLQAYPGCYFRAGIGEPQGPPTPHHSPEFMMNESGLDTALAVALRVLWSAASNAPPGSQLARRAASETREN